MLRGLCVLIGKKFNTTKKFLEKVVEKFRLQKRKLQFLFKNTVSVKNN